MPRYGSRGDGTRELWCRPAPRSRYEPTAGGACLRTALASGPSRELDARATILVVGWSTGDGGSYMSTKEPMETETIAVTSGSRIYIEALESYGLLEGDTGQLSPGVWD